MTLCVPLCIEVLKVFVSVRYVCSSESLYSIYESVFYIIMCVSEGVNKHLYVSLMPYSIRYNSVCSANYKD